MRILIVSDSHGMDKYLYQTIRRVKPFDMMIHLGDFGGTEEYIRSLVDCPVEMVSGNNDFLSGWPREKLLSIGNYTVFLTHGHRYGVYFSIYPLKEAARARNANIVMFGHTHVPMIDLKGDIWAINPGSIAYPRQRGRVPSFIIMEIDREGMAHFTLNLCGE